MSRTQQEIDRDEVVELLRELIRIDTSNPPGNETAAAEFLSSYMRDAGAECELAGPDPDRLNLIARVHGTGEGPSLMLMGHTDVVPAPRDRWTVDPFEGALRDGLLVGRGAADMKGELAARAVALAAFARSGERPTGDVVLVAESDEEGNRADVGMSWLARERPDIRCDYAINEGGGASFQLADGRTVATVSVGEKQVSSAMIRVHGRAGHASIPQAAENPLVHAAEVVERLASAPTPLVMREAVERALEVLGVKAADDAASIEAVRELSPMLADELWAMTHMTVTPTGLRTHEPANVIPPSAEIICDTRALPGQTEADLERHVAEALGDDFRWDFELLEPLVGGTESPIDTPLYGAVEDYVAERLPGAILVPLVTSGFTDSHWVRNHLDTVAYGFAPVFEMDLDTYFGGMHGADESLAVADLTAMAEFSLAAIRQVACAA